MTADSATRARSTARDGSLYAAHRKIYPRTVRGTFRRIKDLLLPLLLGIYFIGPWIPWNRPGDAPDQAILGDLAGRRGYFFAIEIWPQEVYYLTGLLLLAAVGLFFATSLFGRVWCGFTCFQTVFTDLFVKIERAIEGERPARMRLDRAPLSAGKLGKKALKNAVWLIVALATAYTFLLYFNEAPAKTAAVLSGDIGGWFLALLIVLTTTTFLAAGYAREQVCIYMCPYARFQSAMVDEHSMIVSYETWRGEPRGPARKDADFANRGDCVDCRACVQVCPTGIDIRDGMQLACIGCALCIDACNETMDRYGLPRGLISYDSITNQNRRANGLPARSPLIRTRTLYYVILLALIGGVMLFTLLGRDRVEVNVLHERSPLYVTLSDGAIRNGYTFKILNMLPQPQDYRLSADGVDGLRLSVVGRASESLGPVLLPAPADSVASYRVYVTAPTDADIADIDSITFRLQNTETGETIVEDAPFAGPRS